ncbi:MAG: hypothetical protein M5U25_19860 [Planctomycetota bacterium]|nr:hypothetical protein [Planctomycetota bacterium]
MRRVLLLGLAALLAACAAERLPSARGAEPEPDPVVEPAPEPVNELAQRAYTVLRDNCWGCHGQPGKKAYGETTPLDWILDYDKLIETKTVVPGHPGKSRLIYITAVEGKMPRAFDEQGAPSIEVGLSDEDQQTLIDWIKEGAPRWR